jgi:hypothetical protein
MSAVRCAVIGTRQRADTGISAEPSRLALTGRNTDHTERFAPSWPVAHTAQSARAWRWLGGDVGWPGLASSVRAHCGIRISTDLIAQWFCGSADVPV